MNFELLTTPRLILRKLTPEVYDFIFKSYNENELKTFLGTETAEEMKVERERYEKGLSTFNKSFLYFQLLDKVNQHVIGWCGYHTWYLEHFRAEIFYMLKHDENKKKGLMSEAMDIVLDYGFKTMNLHRIEALVGPDNVASLRMMEKYNFTKEGTLREHYFVNNKMEDSVLFSLLKSDRLKLKKA